MAVVIAIPEKLTGVRVENGNFSGRDLKKANLSGSVFLNCNFDRADMSHADCSGADFTGSTFRQSILYRSNFANAKLAGIVFEPADAYGIIFSMECRTFDNMGISQLWWYGYIMFATMMWPGAEPVKDNLRNMLIGMIGAERHAKLSALFRRREF